MSKREVERQDVWVRRGAKGALIIIVEVIGDGRCRVLTPHLGKYRTAKVSTILRDYRYERKAG